MQPTVYWYQDKIYTTASAIPLGINRGLSFGDGLFETIRVHNGQPTLLPYHEARLLGGAQALGLHTQIPNWETCVEKLLHELGNPTEARLKWLIFRHGAGAYMPHTSESGLLLTLTPSSPSMYCCAPAVSLTTQTGVVPPQLPSGIGKTLSALHYVMAAQQAKHLGADHALLLSPTGQVLETEHANVAYWANETLHLCTGGIPGTLQSHLANLSRQKGIPCTFTNTPLERLLRADAVWLTNSSIGAQPVQAIDSQSLPINAELNTILWDMLH